jgi:hypothetical protein
LNSSDAHDSYLVCSQGSCVVGFRKSAGGNLDPFGGTSVSAQVFAGILAILNQATNSKGLGNANLQLYALAASSPAAFHDITTGNNMVPCTSGTVDCPAGTTEIGYSAKPGYDLATGLGSLDVAVLAKAWPGFVGFTLSATAVMISSPGVSGTSTITVAAGNGFTGTVNLTCTPPASVEISCSFGTTTPVTVSGTNATATMTVTTTAPHATRSNPTSDARPRGGIGWFTASGGALFAGFFMIGLPSRRRRGTAMLGLLFCVGLAVGVGCGGGSSSGNPPTDPGTPANTYTVVVTGMGSVGGFKTTTNVTVTVQ